MQIVHSIPELRHALRHAQRFGMGKFVPNRFYRALPLPGRQ